MYDPGTTTNRSARRTFSGDDDIQQVLWHGVAMSVVRTDGSKRGWIAIALDEDGSTRGLFVERLDDLGTALAACAPSRSTSPSACHLPADGTPMRPSAISSARVSTQLGVLRTGS